VHLIAAEDRPWLHALLAERNARMFGARFERFGIVDEVNAMRRDVVELCAERPATGRGCCALSSSEATRRSSRVRSTLSFRGSRRRV
jgi:hypothetical protein